MTVLAGNEGIEFAEQLIYLQLVEASSMLKGLQVCNLALAAFKVVPDKDLGSLRILSDNIADNHILGDHVVTSHPDKERGCHPASPLNRLLQVLDRLFNAIHAFFDVFQTDGVGQAGVTVIAKGNTGHQSDLGIFQ